jgi:hypothetical protein
MESATAALVRQIQSLGYAVEVRAGIAEARKPGQSFLLYYDPDADQEYNAACQLAQLIGIDLEG